MTKKTSCDFNDVTLGNNMQWFINFIKYFQLYLLFKLSVLEMSYKLSFLSNVNIMLVMEQRINSVVYNVC